MDQPASPRARGRPRGDSRTKADILAAARGRFLRLGYGRVTMRSIASDAGVDAALISYYFDSKRGLFGAAMRVDASPPDVLVAALRGPLERLPQRLLSLVLAVWDDPERGPSLLALAQTALHDPESGRLFREMAEREMVTRLAARLGGRDAHQRAAIATSQLTGLVVTRYVLRIEPVASMTHQELIVGMTPALRQALSGRLRPPPSARG